MAAVQRGEVDVIIVCTLWRNRRERAEGIEILRKHEVSVLCVSRDLLCARHDPRGAAVAHPHCTPLPVCDSTASRRASEAARRGSPGEVQPWMSARIRAPIHSWYGL